MPLGKQSPIAEYVQALKDAPQLKNQVFNGPPGKTG